MRALAPDPMHPGRETKRAAIPASISSGSSSSDLEAPSSGAGSAAAAAAAAGKIPLSLPCASEREREKKFVLSSLGGPEDSSLWFSYLLYCFFHAHARCSTRPRARPQLGSSLPRARGPGLRRSLARGVHGRVSHGRRRLRRHPGAATATEDTHHCERGRDRLRRRKREKGKSCKGR